MTDELIKRLRHADAPYAKPTALEILTDEAADLIEQQAAEIVNLKHDIERHIANHAADLNAVAPAVDAQPVAWRHKATKILRNDSIAKGADFEPADWEPLYTAAQSEGLRKDAIRREALEQASALCQAIANGYVSDVNPKRSREAADAAIFCAREIAALSQHTGEKDD